MKKTRFVTIEVQWENQYKCTCMILNYMMETKPKRSCEIRRNKDEEVKESVRKDKTN